MNPNENLSLIKKEPPEKKTNSRRSREPKPHISLKTHQVKLRCVKVWKINTKSTNVQRRVNIFKLDRCIKSAGE